MHFPHLRMHQPFWPYSSASCRLSCFFAASAFLPAPFMFAVPERAEPCPSGIRCPDRPGPLPVRSLLPNTIGAVPIRRHARSFGPVCGRALRSLVERPAGMPSIIRPSSRPCNRRNRRSQKAFARVPGAPGASFAGLMILRSGAAPLQGTNNHRCLGRQSCRRLFSGCVRAPCGKHLGRIRYQDQSRILRKIKGRALTRKAVFDSDSAPPRRIR